MKSINGNVLLIKEVNLNIVRKALKEIKRGTKTQIAKLTGLSLGTVSTTLQILLENNEIKQIKEVKSNGGRPAQEFFYNFDYMSALIIFPFEKNNKTFLTIDVIDLKGESIENEILEVDEINLNLLKKVTLNKIKKIPNIKIVGFGNPGINIEGKITYSDYKELVSIDLSKEFEEEFGLPVMIENDITLAVVGFSKRKKVSNDNLVYLFFPDKYPPGSGILIDGKIYKGTKNYAGEIGYIKDFIWNEEVYKNFELFCTNTSRMINMISCILNPKVIILYGNFINESHIEFIRDYCNSSLDENLLPHIHLSERFFSDYKVGLIERTLDSLIPNISITRS